MSKGVILLVEDDLALLEGIGDYLELEGFSVVKAANGLEGLEAVKDVTPDLIISDIMMPQMDGHEFHRAVRALPNLSSVPFIFLTARAHRDDVRRGLQEGVDAYLTKPFDLDDLLLYIENRLDRFATLRNQALSQLEDLQRQIITMFSHEFRTPLTYIQGYTDLLSDESCMVSAEEQKLFLEKIRVGSHRLARLVESLLSLSQLDTHAYKREFDEFALDGADLGELVRDAVASLSDEAADKGIAIEVEITEPLFPVRIVPVHVDQALKSLLDNAIKFTPAFGENIKVRVFGTDKRVNISVIDRGIGIPAEDLPRIFKRFHQVDRSTHEQPGIGVGLAIAGGLAHAQGGDIEVESTFGEGSVFTLWVPIAWSPAASDLSN